MLGDSPLRGDVVDAVIVVVRCHIELRVEASADEVQDAVRDA